MNRTIFRWMLVEEWRLHSDLFGGARFGAFPLVVAVLTGLGTWLLGVTGTPLASVAAGLVGLVGFFGLQVGTIGLVGRDALRDVLGDVTLLVFSARTLPVSFRRLLATFLVKDVCYYAALVLTPAVVGYGAVAVLTGESIARVGLLWVVVVAAFGFGAALSLTLIALASRARVALIGLLAVGTTAVVAADLDPVSVTPYVLYADPSLASAVRGVGPTVLLALVGVGLFDPSSEGTGSGRRLPDRLFVRVRDPLSRRSLLSVSRSSGSVSKVAFSMGVLFAVTALLLAQVTAATGVRPHAGVAFGTLLGLGAFTTYSWVTQFDDRREYLRYPVSYARVFRSALRSYLVLSLAAGVGYLAIAAVWFRPVALAVGVAVLPGVAVYVFGVTAFITGLSPNELLFDTPLFVVFGGALAALAVPMLVAALAVSLAPTALPAAAVALATAAGGVGLWLTRRAGPRWDRRLRHE